MTSLVVAGDCISKRPGIYLFILFKKQKGQKAILIAVNLHIAIKYNKIQ